VIASVLSLELIESAPVLQAIRERFEKRALRMPDGNRKQAAVPRGARVLANPNGTAPGLWIEHGPSVVVLLPGPPRELQPMLDGAVLPALGPRTAGRKLHRRIIRIAGRPESHVEEIANPIYSAFARGDVPIETTILASPGQIELHLSARGPDGRLLDEALADAVAQLVEALGPSVVSSDGRSLEEVIAGDLLSRRWRLAVAESCTGGMLGARLTDVAGSSEWFKGGVVAYANDIKTMAVDVPDEVIAQYGAVSEPVAAAMADGIRQKFQADVGVGVTGIAGPTGGTAEKPVGTVTIAVSAGPVVVRTFRFPGDRAMIRQQSVVAALDMLRRAVRGDHSAGGRQ
jgi:nicotinamide-nucleotide amidase